MAYGFVQQVETSQGTGTSSLAAPSLTPTLGNMLLILTAGANTTTSALSDGGVGNTFTQLASFATASSKAILSAAYNCKGGASIITTTSTGGSDVGAILVQEFSGLALVGAYQTSLSANQSNFGVIGANAITTVNLNPSAQPAMLWGLCWDLTQPGLAPSAGTSPSAFSARTAIWSALPGAAGASSLPMDVRITSTGGVPITAGTSAPNQYDNFLTIGAIFSEVGAFGPAVALSPPRTQFFVTDTLVQQ